MNIIKTASSKIDANSRCIAYEYNITQSEKLIDDIGLSTVYGIMIGSSACDGYYHIQDITSEAEHVEKLFELIVKLNVSPYHLYDIVEDILCEI